MRSVTMRAMLGISVLSASAAAQPSVPARIDRPGFRVLLVTPAAAAAIDQPRAVRALFASCQRELQIFPADTTHALATRDWDDTAPLDPDRLTVYVFPRARERVSCGGEELRDQVAITRGLQLLTPSPFTAAEDVRRVELRVGTRVISPSVTERVQLTVLSNRGARVTAANAVRIRVPIVDLAPTASGQLDGITLRVWMADSLTTDTVSIPWATIEPLWQSFLAGRSARASAAFRGRLPLYQLASSNDADLAAAHRAYLDGDAASANRNILSRLGGRELSWRDERSARLQLAVTFASLGDTTSTRVMLSGLLRREPCLTFSETAPALARAVIAPIARTDARCRSLPLSRVAWRSAVLPGFGRPVSGTRAVVQRLLVGGVIGAGLATGFSQNAQARSSYDAYQASRSSADATRLFSQASSARSIARTGFLVATVTWGASIADAMVREWRLSQRLALVQGAAPALSINR